MLHVCPEACGVELEAMLVQKGDKMLGVLRI